MVDALQLFDSSRLISVVVVDYTVLFFLDQLKKNNDISFIEILLTNNNII